MKRSPPPPRPDTEHVSWLLTEVEENVRQKREAHELLNLLDEFKSYTPHWPLYERARVFWRAMEQGVADFYRMGQHCH